MLKPPNILAKVFLLGLFTPILGCEKTETITVTLQGKAGTTVVTVGATVDCQGTQPISSQVNSSFADEVNILSDEERGKRLEPLQEQAICNGETVLLFKGDVFGFVVDQINYQTAPSSQNIWNNSVKAAQYSVEAFNLAQETNDYYDWHSTVWALEGTIKSFQSIPSDHPNYSEAQQHIEAYTISLNEARANVERTTEESAQ